MISSDVQMKKQLVFALFLAVALCTAEESVEDSLDSIIAPYGTVIKCEPQPGDILLFQRHFEDVGATLTKKKRTIYYPEKGDPPNSVINCIKAYDNIGATSTNGGSFKIVSGGLGQSSVIMRIKSKRGYGYNYDVELWGQPLARDSQN